MKRKIIVNIFAFLTFFVFVVGVSMMNTEILKGLLVTLLCVPLAIPVYLDWRKEND